MRSTILLAAAALVVTTTPAVAWSPQVSAGPVGLFKDLETWSRYSDDTQLTERGVGLVVPGATAPLLVSFNARQRGRNPVDAPREIAVQVARTANVNPMALPSLTLTLTIDAGTPSHAVFDLTPRIVVDNPVPGGAPTSIVATMVPAEFRRLAAATTLRGTLFGTEVTFRPAQIKALRAFFSLIGVRAPGISPLIELDKARFALGESVFFWVGVKAGDDGLVPRAWQVDGTVTITRPDGTTKVDRVSWPMDGMTDRGWRGGHGFTAEQLGTYTAVFEHSGQTTPPAYFSVAEVPVLRDIAARFEFPSPLSLSANGGSVTLVIENRSHETIRVPHRGGLMGHVTVQAQRTDGTFSSSGFYPETALLEASGIAPASSFPLDGYSWRALDTVPTITIQPGGTFRLSLPVSALMAQQARPWPAGEYTVTFATRLDVLIGERTGPWADVSPVRLDVRSTARGTR
jgi:hypothetical protein